MAAHGLPPMGANRADRDSRMTAATGDHGQAVTGVIFDALDVDPRDERGPGHHPRPPPQLPPTPYQASTLSKETPSL